MHARAASDTGAVLTTLNAGSNAKLARVPDLTKCPKLRVLFVDDCPVVDFDAANTPDALPKLERLNVLGNKMDEPSKVRVAALDDTVRRNGGWLRGATPPLPPPPTR